MSRVTLQDIESLRQELHDYHLTHARKENAVESCTEAVCIHVRASIQILEQHLDRSEWTN